MKNRSGAGVVVAGAAGTNAGYPRNRTSVPVVPERSVSPVDRGEAVRCLARSVGLAQCTLDAGHEVERGHEWCGLPFEAEDFNGRPQRSWQRRTDTTNGSAPAEGADAEGERGSGPAVGARSAPKGAGDEEWFDLIARALKASVKNTAAARAALTASNDALCAAQEQAAQDAAALDFAKCIERERDELSAAGRIARAALQSVDDAFGHFTYEGSGFLLAIQGVREALDVLNEALDTAPALSPADHAATPSSGEREPIQPEPVRGEVLR